MPPVAEDVRRGREAPVHTKWLAGILLALIAAVAAFILLFQWNWLRPPLANYLELRLHRTVAINGDLEVHPWSWTPRATVRGLVIGNPAWTADRDPMTEIPALTVSIELPRLLRGQTVLPLVSAQSPRVHLIRDAQGRANWNFGTPNTAGEPLRLPAIRHFIIDNGRLRIDDAQRHVVFVGTVTTNERSTGPDRGVFQLIGDGTLNRSPFTARVTGAPLLNVSPDRPYPFEAHVTSGPTRIDARGIVPHPFDLGRFSTQLEVQGPDASRLYNLTGLAFPNTPPYHVSGAFERNDREYDYRRFSGRVGDSDIAGAIHVTTRRGERPFLRADLASRRLDLDDLMAVVGGPPSVGRGETASAEQVAMARRLNAQGRLLPDAHLDTSRLRAMNADVRYRADTVNARMPIRALSMHVTLDDALLTVDPLSATLPRGSLAGNIRVNARGAAPVTALDLRLSNARLEDLLPGRGAGTLSGGLFARARLTGTGDSVRRAAANANGQFSVVIPRGQIRAAFAELMGVNATRGLFLLLSHDDSQAQIRCAVANFHAANGVLTADNIVFDTDVVASHGRGVINLQNETMNVRLEGRSKHFRLVRVMAPVTLKGSFAHPRPGLDLGAAAGQIGIGAILGAVVSPLAAILPFIDPGLGHDADCGALIASARAQGAPVAARR
jgi:uncharacterized protein involved in outer membrane biogenesis